MDVYGPLIYGIVLFPHIEDYIDLAAIDAFLAKRDIGENLIITILANTYYSMNYFYERNGKGLRSRLEQVSLTFGDPRLGADKGPDPSHARPYESSKKVKGGLRQLLKERSGSQPPAKPTPGKSVPPRSRVCQRQALKQTPRKPKATGVGQAHQRMKENH
ncbi:hypothetical protein CR513_46679, partial [Mucuna pruriens]